jgi:hypothetical protein
MKNGENILIETCSISSAVGNLPKTNPYSLSEEYFSEFPSKIYQLIFNSSASTEKEDVLTTLRDDSLKSTQAFSLPTNYFNSFSHHLVKKIASTSEIELELQELAPSLLSLKKENPFKIPANYFEQIKITKPKEKAKVVGMFTSKTFFRYAAAACFVSILYFSYFATNTALKENTLATTISVEKTNNLSDEGMVSFLNEVDEVSNNTENEFTAEESNNMLVDLNQETIKQVLSEIHEDEMKEFIELTGISDNNITN